MPTLAERFSAFATGPLAAPAEVRAAARLHLLDAVGCGLAAHALGLGGAARAATADGSGPCTVIGAPGGRPARDAALANGALVHVLDYDDTHQASICHVSAVVAPAALAAGEEAGASGAAVLAAYLAGCEIVPRIGALAAGAFHRRGFHPTAVCGVFGAAVAAARLRGLGAEATTRALGIAGSMASGLMAYLSDGSRTKPLHAGWAAHAGVMAAALAAHGGEGPSAVLEDRFGVLAAFVGGVAPDGAGADLGTRWETPLIAFKLFPCCHFSHGVLAAGAELRAGGLQPGEVEAIEIEVTAEAAGVVLEPAGEKAAPRTPYDAQFSLPWCLGVVLLDGGLALDSFSAARIADPGPRELAARVTHRVADLPSPFGGALTVRRRDGSALHARHDHPPGAPEQPPDADAVLHKWDANARLALDGAEADALREALLGLDEADDVRVALSPLARARR